MIKFRNLKNIILILISLLIGAGVTAMATPNNLMTLNTQSTQSTFDKLIKLRLIWESFAGPADENNGGDHLSNTAWNANNRIGADDSDAFLTQSQANAKINHQINLLKTIWQNFGGIVSPHSQSEWAPNSPWNDNNRIGDQDSYDFLTPSQANAKITHRRNKLKIIWQNWGGIVNYSNTADGTPPTAWNANNRIGADDSDAFLTASQVNAKIERQRDLKLNTFTVAGWSLDGTVLTSNNNDKGTFVLTFSVIYGTLKYTLVNTESEEAADFWLAFNSQFPKNANDANTPTKVEAIINDAFITARATLSELDRINALFDDNTSWVLNGIVLTGTIENKGTFSLTFKIDANDWTLKYTLVNIASEEADTFWSTFNAAHQIPKDANAANTITKVDTLINTAYSNATELARINAVFTDDADTSWELTGSVLSTIIPDKGTFSLTFTINTDGTLKYTLANTETEEADTFWSTFNAAHQAPKDAATVSTVIAVNTLINNAYNIATNKATLTTINALFTDDVNTDWEFDITNNWLTTITDRKGTFNLTFTIEDGTLKYTIVQTADADDADWTAFNAEHNAAKDASTVDTVTKVQDLIAAGHTVAAATWTELREELTNINALFTADAGWTLEGTVLMSVNNDKGTFALTFLIENGILKYTLLETASAEDADWSAFNSAHEIASDATAVNTLANVNTLIAAAHIVAIETTPDSETATNETTEKAKGSVIGIIVMIIVALFTLPPLAYFGFRYIKKRNKTS